MAAAGIEGPQACPRGLRHGYGVAAVLGHASLDTTAIYTTALGAEARELVARVGDRLIAGRSAIAGPPALRT